MADRPRPHRFRAHLSGATLYCRSCGHRKGYWAHQPWWWRWTHEEGSVRI
jgi:hypothetical protein